MSAKILESTSTKILISIFMIGIFLTIGGYYMKKVIEIHPPIKLTTGNEGTSSTVNEVQKNSDLFASYRIITIGVLMIIGSASYFLYTKFYDKKVGKKRGKKTDTSVEPTTNDTSINTSTEVDLSSVNKSDELP